MDSVKSTAKSAVVTIKNRYIKFSLVLLNTLVLFLVLNLVAWIGMRIYGSLHRKENIVSQKYNNDLRTVYPQHDPEAVNQLLLETWSRQYGYEPYTQIKERPFHGEFINVSDRGYRETGFVKKWPLDKHAFNIFLFGGSTMFGYGVADEETVSASLENYFRHLYPSLPIMVYNFGRGSYYSSQESILFLRLLSQGGSPDVAIFVDGLNEFYYNTDEPHASEFIKKYVDSASDQKADKAMLNDMLCKYLPAYKLILSVVQSVSMRAKDINRKVVKLSDKYSDGKLLDTVINRYLRNKILNEGIGSAFNVKTIFVWQPVPTYKFDVKNSLFMEDGFGDHSYSGYGYPLMEKYLALHPLGANFIWGADIQQDSKEPLYVDKVHYSATMSKRLGEYIGSEIMKRHLVNPASHH
jgi:hypothetical protein